MIATANSNAASLEEDFLRAAWNRASLPLQDTRPEAMELYEERRTEARSALMQHRKQHPETARRMNLRLVGQLILRSFQRRTVRKKTNSPWKLKRLSPR